jgi:solute:Na+ symporter, SSS family
MDQAYAMGIYDYIVIGFYFIFMLVVGVVFSRSSKNSGDYLRGGGSMTWWMAGGSIFLGTFSAWTFVGCAGKVYKTGMLVVVLFLFNALSMFFVAWLMAHRFRRMRFVTAVEAVRQRFGFASEQLYAWQGSIMAFALGGIMLYTLSVFIAPLIGVDIRTCIILVGVAVTFLSVTGGVWAVMASDFVQMLVILTITIVAAVLVLRMPEVGGVSGFVEQLPSYHFHWTELSHPRVVGVWIGAIFVNQLFAAHNLMGPSSRFFCVQSDAHARKAALLVAIGFLVGPLIWFIPPMAASFVIPDIAAEFPYLKNPEEASYAAICMRVFPRGLMGLLACGIFAATVSSMNTALNINSGIMVQNIYKPLFRKNASERELLIAARASSLLLGCWTIMVGIWFSKLTQMPLFEWTLLLAGLITIPLTVPLVLGLFIKKTPGWSAWSTVLVGLVVAYLVKFRLPVQWVAGRIGIDRELSISEAADIQFSAMILVVTVVTFVWFLFTRRFFQKVSPERQLQVDEFFKKMDTPVTPDSDEHRHTDSVQYQRLSVLCLAYGGFTLLGVLIPNPLSGRLCFAFCGGVIMAVGGWLRVIYIRKTRHRQEESR